MSEEGEAAVARQGADDAVLPFQVDTLDVRGRVVRLGPSIDALLGRHGYPAPVSRVLGEAAALTVLLGASLKFEGSLQLQTRSDGPVEMLVVDFVAPGKIRAYARFDEERLGEVAAHDTGALLGTGHLAFTIEPGGDMSRYQGVVPLTGESLEEAAHVYFRQSEQIPTRVRLAVAETWTGGGMPGWRAGGMLVQFLPAEGERVRIVDLDPGDTPDGVEAGDGMEDDDAWFEAQALVGTVEDHELIDPTLSSERLLFRLFHEQGVRVFDGTDVREECRCSRERVQQLIRQFTTQDRHDMVADDGAITVTCEFCSSRYRFDPAEFDGAPDGNAT